MSELQTRVCGGDRRWYLGGILTYATERLFDEIAYVAYHFHWGLDEILDLEHPIRRQFVEQIGTLNRRLSGEE